MSQSYEIGLYLSIKDVCETRKPISLLKATRFVPSSSLIVDDSHPLHQPPIKIGRLRSRITLTDAPTTRTVAGNLDMEAEYVLAVGSYGPFSLWYCAPPMLVVEG